MLLLIIGVTYDVLWLSDMTSVFIAIIIHSESLHQKMRINQHIFDFSFQFAACRIL